LVAGSQRQPLSLGEEELHVTIVRPVLIAALALFATGVLAADPVAPPDSPVGAVGKVIIDKAAGRPYEDAYAASKNDYNPYGLDPKALLAASGTAKISEDLTGAAVKPGELSILPQFFTPGGKFVASVDTPPTIPFAFFKDGACQAGYVAGFPAPTTTFVADLAGKPCSAISVDDRNWDAYKLIEAEIDRRPKNLSDADLETVVRTAYTAAAAHSAANGNYFARDGAFGPLHDAVAAELSKQGFESVVVPTTPAESLDAARKCLAAPGTELRIAVNPYGDGLSLVAVGSTRVFSYHYDPHEKAEIVVAPAADCVK
jgi:hypothetical protein